MSRALDCRIRTMAEAGHDAAEIAASCQVRLQVVGTMLAAMACEAQPSTPASFRSSVPVLHRFVDPCARHHQMADDLAAGGCRWIEGDVPDHAVCGAPQREGSSYCAVHHARAYKPVRKRAPRAPSRSPTTTSYGPLTADEMREAAQ